MNNLDKITGPYLSLTQNILDHHIRMPYSQSTEEKQYMIHHRNEICVRFLWKDFNSESDKSSKFFDISQVVIGHSKSQWSFNGLQSNFEKRTEKILKEVWLFTFLSFYHKTFSLNKYGHFKLSFEHILLKALCVFSTFETCQR